ncbi:MAG TPA: single-stranded-DNA-specific exonuclease RecJ, partial [Nitrolancea sp.]|nr:single-stranded-DNA-specific exonuclease RecJ [Nitrolancea sp.]
MTRYSWVEPEENILSRFDLTDSPLMCAILEQRGFTSPDDVAEFLSPDLDRLANPFLLPDMQLAVQRIRDAIDAGQVIGIFGDYDADGVTSTAVLTRALALLDANVRTYLPHRIHDGYGLNRGAIDRMVADGVSLLVALDCGTSDFDEIVYAQSHGLRTVVVDHHHIQPGQAPLPDTAFVSAQRADSTFPFNELAAVGVTYYLVRALLGDARAATFLPLVALGTVADVVPLAGENRTLVQHGLRRFARDGVLGLRCLADEAGIDAANVSSYHCGFVLGPRINAAGRMAEPDIALELLLTDDRVRAAELAQQLGKLNATRQQQVRAMLAAAEDAVLRDGGEQPFLMVGGSGWSPGLVGLVAGRLTERFYRPSLALSIGEEISRGSARSIEAFNIVEALDQCRDLLLEHGGHSQAAGLSVRTSDIPRLEARLVELAREAFGDEAPRMPVVIDAELHGRELSLKTAQLLTLLEPYGAGNPEPRFLLRSVMVRSPRRTRDGRHLQFDLETLD